MYEIHIRVKNPDDPSLTAGFKPSEEFETVPEAKRYLRRLVKKLEVLILDSETGEVVERLTF